LDDALMLSFGGANIAALMQKMGMSETEVIAHSVVTSSIANAQKKLLKKVTYEQQAKSPEEWFRFNLARS
jgi:preprotein translocase subunit SecA